MISGLTPDNERALLGKINQVVDGFEAELKKKGNPRLESYLEGWCDGELQRNSSLSSSLLSWNTEGVAEKDPASTNIVSAFLNTPT